MMNKKEYSVGRFVIPHQAVLRAVDAISPLLGVRADEVEHFLEAESGYGRYFNIEVCAGLLNNLLKVYQNPNSLDEDVSDFVFSMYTGVDEKVSKGIREELLQHLALYTAMAVCFVAMVDGKSYIKELKKIQCSSISAAASLYALINLMEYIEQNKKRIR